RWRPWRRNPRRVAARRPSATLLPPTPTQTARTARAPRSPCRSHRSWRRAGQPAWPHWGDGWRTAFAAPRLAHPQALRPPSPGAAPRGPARRASQARRRPLPTTRAHEGARCSRRYDEKGSCLSSDFTRARHFDGHDALLDRAARITLQGDRRLVGTQDPAVLVLVGHGLSVDRHGAGGGIGGGERGFEVERATANARDDGLEGRGQTLGIERGVERRFAVRLLTDARVRQRLEMLFRDLVADADDERAN